MKVIKNYLARVENYPFWRFVLELSFWAVVTATFLDLLFPTKNTPGFQYLEELYRTRLGFFLISALLLGPIIETLFQILSIKVLSFFTKKDWIQIVISALVFASLHGFSNYFIVIFPVGIIFAYSFVIQARKSFWTGFCATFLIHSIYNLATTVAYELF